MVATRGNHWYCSTVHTSNTCRQRYLQAYFQCHYKCASLNDQADIPDIFCCSKPPRSNQEPSLHDPNYSLPHHTTPTWSWALLLLLEAQARPHVQSEQHSDKAGCTSGEARWHGPVWVHHQSSYAARSCIHTGLIRGPQWPRPWHLLWPRHGCSRQLLMAAQAQWHLMMQNLMMMMMSDHTVQAQWSLQKPGQTM
jgi:hypothetical protein